MTELAERTDGVLTMTEVQYRKHGHRVPGSHRVLSVAGVAEAAVAPDDSDPGPATTPPPPADKEPAK